MYFKDENEENFLQSLRADKKFVTRLSILFCTLLDDVLLSRFGINRTNI